MDIHSNDIKITLEYIGNDRFERVYPGFDILYQKIPIRVQFVFVQLFDRLIRYEILQPFLIVIIIARKCFNIVFPIRNLYVICEIRNVKIRRFVRLYRKRFKSG